MNNDDSPSGARRDSPLDLAIDRAVRRMMHVDPPAGLRHRVLARLGPVPSRRAAFFPRFAMAAAALAMLVLAVIAVRRETTAPVPGPDSQPAVTIARVNPPALEVPTPAPPAPAASADRTVRHGSPRAPRGAHSEAIRMPRIGNVFGARGSGVAATNAPAAVPDIVFPPAGAAPERAAAPGDAITIVPLSAIPGIVIPPLQIENLRIEPLPIRR